MSGQIRTVSQQEVYNYLGQMDINEDGKVSKPELLNLFKRMNGMGGTSVGGSYTGNTYYGNTYPAGSYSGTGGQNLPFPYNMTLGQNGTGSGVYNPSTYGTTYGTSGTGVRVISGGINSGYNNYNNNNGWGNGY